MIDSAPRPLLQHRLARLVHGLRERMTGSLQKMSQQIDELDERITEHEVEYSKLETELLKQAALQLDGSTTKWDEALHDCWDKAELRAYRAVHDTALQESKLRKNAEEQIAHVTQETKKRGVEIERGFLRAKDVPLKRLKKFRAANLQALQELDAVESSAEAALAQRSLRTPSVEPEEPALPNLKNSTKAFEQLQEAQQQARYHCDRLANNRLAKLFESVWWWGLCSLAFIGLTIGLTAANLQPFIPALVISACATVVMILLGYIGVRPWLKRSAAKEFPRVRGFVELGRKIHGRAEQLAVEENDAELKRLAAKRDERFLQAKNWREQQIVEITKKLNTSLTDLRAHAVAEKEHARSQLSVGLDDTNAKFDEQLSAESNEASQRQSQLRGELDSHRQSLRSRIDELNRGGALRMQIATQKAMQVITRSRRWCDEVFPQWDDLVHAEEHWPETLHEPVLPLGNLPLREVLPNNAKLDLGDSQLQAPMLFAPLHDEYLTITGDPNEPAVQHLVRNLVLRALTTLPPGKTHVCVIDPPGLGRDYGWLMHLSDFDAQLVSHRVWTQPSHIAKQVNALALAAEDFIQQSLRNQYQHIVQYNQDAGALAEPYRILVWSSMPSGLDDQSWKSLQSLLDSGARCGIIPILVIDPNVSWPASDQLGLIKRRGMHLELSEDGRSFSVQGEANQPIPIRPTEAAPDGESQRIVEEIGRRALLSNRVEVPLERMVPTGEERWQADSSNCLEIPIGQSGVGRTHSLKLGVGTAQHAIIAGKTGSGKSSLLHAMITSALLKYSPERLRVVLLDFKKGVEFQVYSDSKIPHADIIGIESHREFGLSALEYVDDCMQRRGESFRSAGVQDIASWNALNPDTPIPRMLVVVDEFQELFVEDDKLSGQASLILDRIVRQGRSFGVHAILSSQTLAGSYSLPRTTLGQMAVRIALQCDPSDAQIIFAEDNPAAARLKHPGQAVYNDAGGRIEGNQPMQIGWLPKKQQIEWFGEMPGGYQNDDVTTNRLGRTVVYDGNRAAKWDSNNANLAIEYASAEVNPDALWCVTGESVAINPAVLFPLTRQAGRNAIIVGSDDSQAAAVMHVVAASMARATKGSSFTHYVVQGAKPTDAKALMLPKLWQEFDHPLKVGESRKADELISEVYDVMKNRMESEDEDGIGAPVLLSLIQIGRMRTLRREDDFGMGGFGESELTADKKLEEILRDGPSLGIHVMIWAESYSTVNRWLSRASLREIEIRALMQMSGNDSTNLIDSVAASKLGDHVMLLYDEATGQEQRFRPFAPDELTGLGEWYQN